MFPTRAIGYLRPPSREQIAEYASRHHLSFDDAETDQMVAAVTASLDLYTRVEELDEPVVPLRHPYRDPGHTPLAGEDPYNAFIRFCEVRGADEGPLVGKTVGVKDCIAVDFVQAQRVRRVALRALGGLFETVDMVATPTASTGATHYDDMAGGVFDVGDVFKFVHTPYWDSVGNPALVMPMGFTAEGLPLSLQLAGRHFDEATLLGAGYGYQQATDWHRRVPALVADTAAA